GVSGTGGMDGTRCGPPAAKASFAKPGPDRAFTTINSGFVRPVPTIPGGTAPEEEAPTWTGPKNSESSQRGIVILPKGPAVRGSGRLGFVAPRNSSARPTD